MIRYCIHIGQKASVSGCLLLRLYIFALSFTLVMGLSVQVLRISFWSCFFVRTVFKFSASGVDPVAEWLVV